MAIKNDQDGGNDEGVSDIVSLNVCAKLDRVKTSHDSNWDAMKEREVKQFDSPYICEVRSASRDCQEGAYHIYGRKAVYQALRRRQGLALGKFRQLSPKQILHSCGWSGERKIVSSNREMSMFSPQHPLVCRSFLKDSSGAIVDF